MDILSDVTRDEKYLIPFMGVNILFLFISLLILLTRESFSIPALLWPFILSTVNIPNVFSVGWFWQSTYTKNVESWNRLNRARMLLLGWRIGELPFYFRLLLSLSFWLNFSNFWKYCGIIRQFLKYLIEGHFYIIVREKNNTLLRTLWAHVSYLSISISVHDVENRTWIYALDYRTWWVSKLRLIFLWLLNVDWSISNKAQAGKKVAFNRKIWPIAGNWWAHCEWRVK